MTGKLAPGQDPFAPGAVSPETLACNGALAQRLQALEPAASIAEARQRLRSGAGATPRGINSTRARAITVASRSGHTIGLRIIEASSPQGVFLHLHGGGWAIGANDLQDGVLEGIVDRAGLTAISVDYRLVPEHVYPAAIDDCEDIALWLIKTAPDLFGSARIFVGGESAGAHLCAATLLRLRDRGMTRAVAGTCLSYGFFDLSLTPSARAAEATLVINRRSLETRARQFAGQWADLRDPKVSPLHADLRDMPPALLTVGTLDPLLDDSMFMHSRWRAAGNRSSLRIFPGGLHGFLLFPMQLAEAAQHAIEAFLRDLG